MDLTEAKGKLRHWGRVIRRKAASARAKAKSGAVLVLRFIAETDTIEWRDVLFFAGLALVWMGFGEVGWDPGGYLVVGAALVAAAWPRRA